jgi:hypothetical protein
MSHVNEQERPCERKLDTPLLTLDDVDQRVRERIASEHEFNINFLTEVLVDLKNDAEMRGPPGPSGPRGEEGPPGKLPIVKLWMPETVYYEGDVVAYDGGSFQAKRDTGQPPSHAHWMCLASSGRDGKTIAVRGTFDESVSYRRLDVVALNGGSFIALKDAPGLCPGPGWQLLASQGKRGPAGEKGERGPRGDAGASGATIVGWKLDRERYLATPVMSDGSDGPPLELRGLFEQFFLGGAMMIEREADQSRGERNSPRALTPEVVEARIALRVAELRVLAAWTVCSPIGPSAASPGGAAQLLAASPPLHSYIRFASRADVNC